jgi:intergrase/recombinase
MIVLSVAGCSTDVTKDVIKLQERMCACTDVTCAKAVLDDLVHLATSTRNARGDEDKTQAAAREMAKCAMKLGLPRKDLEDAMKRVADD